MSYINNTRFHKSHDYAQFDIYQQYMDETLNSDNTKQKLDKRWPAWQRHTPCKSVEWSHVKPTNNREMNPETSRQDDYPIKYY